MRIKLNSSALEFASYNKRKKNLKVSFTDGRQYVYHAVPQEVVNELVAVNESGGSVGQFFNSQIRPNYKFDTE